MKKMPDGKRPAALRPVYGLDGPEWPGGSGAPGVPELFCAGAADAEPGVGLDGFAGAAGTACGNLPGAPDDFRAGAADVKPGVRLDGCADAAASAARPVAGAGAACTGGVLRRARRTALHTQETSSSAASAVSTAMPVRSVHSVTAAVSRQSVSTVPLWPAPASSTICSY